MRGAGRLRLREERSERQGENKDTALILGVLKGGAGRGSVTRAGSGNHSTAEAGAGLGRMGGPHLLPSSCPPSL